jgi:ergothioneine biosynthesis protein EgtB
LPWLGVAEEMCVNGVNFATDDTASGHRHAMLRRFRSVRHQTEALAAPLLPEDQTAQSMPDASPTKWHLAHVTWFWESFILAPIGGLEPFDPIYNYLFNSYYNALGPRHARPQRGLLTRPSCAEVQAYRDHVTGAIGRFIETATESAWEAAAPLLELGIHHEQQHQELILMDIKHLFSINPLLPAYLPASPCARSAAPALEWRDFPGGLVEIGHDGQGFAFDNETPRHKVWLDPFRLADRLVTCGEYREFVEAGGYRNPEFWLSDGWAAVQSQGWEAPLYWRRTDADWRVFTLHGERTLDPAEPVVHVSFYEADAFANWAGRRLPSEAEWEFAADAAPLAGNLIGTGHYHPSPVESTPGLKQMIGDVWQWTLSAYSPYPGFRPPAGPVGEYNGKFMSGQMVLRGGCAVTPEDHIRRTYRNFFPPSARWCFGGIRLADGG